MSVAWPCAVSLAILVCVDGLAGYVAAFRNGFRTPEPTGKPGRPQLRPEPGLQIGQVIKQYRQRRVVSSTTRVVQGTPEQIEAVLAHSGGGKQINTAFIERLNATFRARLAPLARRSRRLMRREASMEAFCIWWVASTTSAPRMPACGWQPATRAGGNGRRGPRRWRRD